MPTVATLKPASRKRPAVALIPLAKITITRAEGPITLIGEPHTFTTWDAASAWMLQNRRTFPKTGGYDKHDLEIVWADGSQYDGRLDAKADGDDCDVLDHCLSYARWYVSPAARKAEITAAEQAEARTWAAARFPGFTAGDATP